MVLDDLTHALVQLCISVASFVHHVLKRCKYFCIQGWVPLDTGFESMCMIIKVELRIYWVSAA